MDSINLDAKYFQTKVGMQMGAKAFIAGRPINPFRVEGRASSARANPGAGQKARGMPGGQPKVIDARPPCRRPSPRKMGGPSSHFLFTEAPVIYSVSCVCVRYKKHCVLQGLLRISKYDAAKMEKCKNAVFFKGDVGNARRVDGHNRYFAGRGLLDDFNCLTYP